MGWHPKARTHTHGGQGEGGGWTPCTGGRGAGEGGGVALVPELHPPGQRAGGAKQREEGRWERGMELGSHETAGAQPSRSGGGGRSTWKGGPGLREIGRGTRTQRHAHKAGMVGGPKR